jgi:uncharacterized membrane protein (DUF106 family)
MLWFLLTVGDLAPPLNIIIAVVLLAFAYATFTLKVQRKLVHPNKTKDLQQRIQKLTKEMNEMAKRNEDISAKQAELMPLMKESMNSQMKVMVVILPIFVIIYDVIIPALFGGFMAQQVSILFITGPLLGLEFIGIAALFGLVLNGAITLLNRRKKNMQQQAQEPQSANAK